MDGITIINTIVTYSITMDDTTTSYSISLTSVVVTVSGFVIFPDTDSRSVATLKSTKVYPSSVTLDSDGRPNRVSTYSTIL